MTVYISEEASIRSYFTVIAVPNGVDTQQFLEDEGWIDLMDQKGEALFVLEPGAEGWGHAAEEKAYMDAAIAFLKSGNNEAGINVFSTFGEFYLAGYGEGAAPGRPGPLRIPSLSSARLLWTARVPETTIWPA